MEVGVAEVGSLEIGVGEVATAEFGVAKVWPSVRVLLPPRIPARHPLLLKQCDMLFVRHGFPPMATSRMNAELPLRQTQLS